MEHIEEKDVEEFKDKLADTTAKTINEIFEEDLQISKDIKKYAAIGKKYNDWIQRFKAAIYVDENVNSYAIKLLKEAGTEIKKLRNNIKKCKLSTAMVKADCDIMEKQIYFNERLNEIKNDTAKKRVKAILLEGDNFDNMTKYEIDERIKEIVEG